MTGIRIIRVQMPDGLVTVTAAPTHTPGLFINENPRVSGSWNITHLASGACIAAYFESPEHALHVAVQLGPVTDWTASGADLLKLLPGLRRKWECALADAGALGHMPAGHPAPVATMEPLS